MYDLISPSAILASDVAHVQKSQTRVFKGMNPNVLMVLLGDLLKLNFHFCVSSDFKIFKNKYEVKNIDFKY